MSKVNMNKANNTLRLNKARILVTGGAGFIGSGLVRTLVTQYPNTHITNLDALTYAGNLENLSDMEHAKNYRFVHGDIRDAKAVTPLVKEADVVINVAAHTHVDRSIEDASPFVSTNVVGTQVLLDAAKQHGIKKFIQISTDEVYGSLGQEGLFSETSPLQPSSPYSASKTAADLLALSYFHTYGLPVCVTRCSNNYGPRQYPEKLIPLFILNAMAKRPLPVYGDGLNIRDWIHVDDHNRAVCRVLEDGQPGEVYNIGANNEWTNLDITRKILELTGQDDSLITYVDDRPGHDRRYAIDSSKIQHDLNWAPEIDFATGLKDTVDWYTENPGNAGVLKTVASPHISVVSPNREKTI